MPNGFFGKTCKKGIKTEKKNIAIELYIFEIVLESNFSLNLILTFWAKLKQGEYLYSKKE